ncbi:hypothetical protein [Streptomyces sp. LN785]|uniref:hypothetical protein n=1 Tax=Streptomyces sp. LN785 TaxID=3112983 RepID=UPI00371D57B2
MRPYLMRGTKTAVVAALATVVAWKSSEWLNAWADHSAGAQVASGESEWTAGFIQYVVAGAAGVLVLPLAVWLGLRLTGVKGNHLAVVVPGFTWFAVVGAHLVDARPGWGTVLWSVTAEAAIAAAAATLQGALRTPEHA